MATGIIFYGYCWEQSNDPPPFDLDAVLEWESEHVRIELAALGFTFENYMAYSARIAEPGGTEAYGVYANGRRVAQEAIERELGASMSFHGSSDYPTPYLRAFGAKLWYTSGAAPIDLAILNSVDPAWKTALDRYLAIHGIEPPESTNQPGWWVTVNDEI
ncbi:hypothetical protein KDL01_09295 [Actinospica durhamensis]|uniref:Uncharacterized protein n=1 Tax=Actinospica durhamensis TaxID=1508375 RepID=A0A941IN11_9ACTN|nr:hypothetical protein [Actinospica durhamensis]MBR7833459.1 hypothetical protein [Actinospica durhamensis]